MQRKAIGLSPCPREKETADTPSVNGSLLLLCVPWWNYYVICHSTLALSLINHLRDERLIDLPELLNKKKKLFLTESKERH